ncbi:hypothetical protein, partial [Escherichia coli]|uniref:hypothetical protein n=1 Tax=Escherichia coli TaxID=562 RepID=UPI001FF12526
VILEDESQSGSNNKPLESIKLGFQFVEPSFGFLLHFVEALIYNVQACIHLTAQVINAFLCCQVLHVLLAMQQSIQHIAGAELNF